MPTPTDVLSYPVEGYIVLLSRWATLRFEGKATKHWEENGNQRIEVQYNGHYVYWSDEKGKEIPLFLVKCKVQHDWDESQRRFVVDSNSSKLLPEQLVTKWGIAFHAYESNNEFLAAHLQALETVAQTGNPDQKEWLRTFLSDTSDGPGKTTLLSLLGK